jgi:hypothetical protein
VTNNVYLLFQVLSFEGGHRIELSNRLLVWFYVETRSSENSKSLRTSFDSTALQVLFTHKLGLLDYLSPLDSSQSLSRKTAKPKKVYQRQLASSLWVDYSDGDCLLRFALSHSKKIYRSCAKTASKPNIASLSRKGPKNIITGCFHWKLSCIEQQSKTCKAN